MSNQLIPMTAVPNATRTLSVNVNGQIINLTMTLRFNEIAQYWVATLFDANGNLLLDGIPFITGKQLPTSAAAAAAVLQPYFSTPVSVPLVNEMSMNILHQFNSSAIGSAVLANASNVAAPDYPNATDLGTDYVLLWGDNPSA